MTHSSAKTLVTCLATAVVLMACDRDADLDVAAASAGKAVDVQSCLPESFGTEIKVLSALNNHREVWIAGGNFLKGSDSRYREESPAHEESVGGFWIDIHEVTNQQFAEFINKTSYVTTAEQKPLASDYPGVPAEKLQAGSALFIPPADYKPEQQSGHWLQWWQFVAGANWRHPEGPGSDLSGRDHHPVVHVSYLDAKAYADWLGRALPTESQWELAAQNAPGTYGHITDQETLAANTWQGFFPVQDKALDGHAGTSPVGCFPPGQTGLYDMIGNVWEWVSDGYKPGHSVDNSLVSDSPVPLRVIKGGSHLCAENYCRRNAPPARQPQEEDFGTGHLGFRTVRNGKAPL